MDGFAARFARVAVVLVAGLLLPPAALAGPWTPAPGHGYAKVAARWHFGFLDYATGTGEVVDIGTYHELFASTYGELGLIDRLTLTLQTDLVRTFVLEDTPSGDDRVHVAPGDPAVGLRWGFLRSDRFVMAVEGNLRAPLASGEPVQAVYAAEDPSRRVGDLRVGAGVWEGEGRLAAGYGWDRVYVAGSIGAQARSGGFAPRIVGDVEVGASFGERWAGRLRLAGVQSFNVRTPPAEGPSGFGDGTSWNGVYLEGDYRVVGALRVGVVLDAATLAVLRRSGGTVVSLYGSTVF